MSEGHVLPAGGGLGDNCGNGTSRTNGFVDVDIIHLTYGWHLSVTLVIKLML